MAPQQFTIGDEEIPKFTITDEPKPDVSKSLFDPANKGINPIAYSQAYAAAHPQQPQSTWQRIKSGVGEMLQPWEGTMAPRTTGEALAPVGMMAADVGGTLVGAGARAAMPYIKEAAEEVPFLRTIGKPVFNAAERLGSYTAEPMPKPRAMQPPAAPEMPTMVAEEPKPMAINASGESDRSLEAINRGKSEARQGVTRYAVDSRSGVRRPILGSDVTPNPSEHIVRSGPEGEFIETSGNRARAGIPTMAARSAPTVQARAGIPAVGAPTEEENRLAQDFLNQLTAKPLPMTPKAAPVPISRLQNLIEEGAGAPPRAMEQPNVSLREQITQRKTGIPAVAKEAEDPIKVAYPDPVDRQFVRANGAQIFEAAKHDPNMLKQLHDLTRVQLSQAAENAGIDMGQRAITSSKFAGEGGISRENVFNLMLKKGLSPRQIIEMAKQKQTTSARP